MKKIKAWKAKCQGANFLVSTRANWRNEEASEMSDGRKPKRPARNVFWRQMGMGDAVGSPLAEWAYRTPRFPNGIAASALGRADRNIQFETGYVWFVSNLKPYHLGPGPWFAFDTPGRGFGQAYYAPSPLTARAVIDQEFDRVLSEEVRGELAASFPERWMFDQVDASFELSATPTPDFDYQRAIIKQLEFLAQAIQGMTREYRGIGHNNLPIDAPLTDLDKSEVLAAIADAKEALVQARRDRVKFEQAWTKAISILAKVGEWMLARGDDYGKSFATSAGEATGKILPWFILISLNAGKILHGAALISEMAKHF